MNPLTSSSIQRIPPLRWTLPYASCGFCRYSCFSQGIDQSQPMHVVCRWLGNSVQTAAKHYLQMTEQHMRQAAQNPTQTVHDDIAAERVIHLACDDEQTLFSRARTRKRMGSRPDDDGQTFYHRLEVYAEQTVPILDFYPQEQVAKVNAADNLLITPTYKERNP